MRSISDFFAKAAEEEARLAGHSEELANVQESVTRTIQAMANGCHGVIDPPTKTNTITTALTQTWVDMKQRGGDVNKLWDEFIAKMNALWNAATPLEKVQLDKAFREAFPQGTGRSDRTDDRGFQ